MTLSEYFNWLQKEWARAGFILSLIDNGSLTSFFGNGHLVIGLGVNAILPVMGFILLKNHQKAEQSSGVA